MGTRVKKEWRWIKCHLRRIDLKDKFLMVIMAILLVQCAYTLFSGAGSSPHSNSIDIVIRTTVSAIFGYFISANFLVKKGDKNTEEFLEELLEESGKEGKRVEILIDQEPMTKEAAKELEREKEEEKTYVNAQTIIVGIIGIFSLLVLIAARDIPGEPVASLASLAQFRDFISGCIGFLIGIQEVKKNQ